MEALLNVYIEPLLVFVLVLARIGGLMLTAPIFSSRSIPVQIRVLITLILSLLVTPLHIGAAEVDPANLIQLISTIAIETTIGATLGLGVMLILSGVQLAGELISQISGSRMADSFNPTFNESVAIFSQVLDLVTVAVFLIIGGHRMMMDSLARYVSQPATRKGFY